jgi:ribosome biogenesis protein BRX1
VLDIIRVFQGSFGGPTIFQNSHYVSPNKVRHDISAAKGSKYKSRVDATSERTKRLKSNEMEPDEVDGVFRLPADGSGGDDDDEDAAGGSDDGSGDSDE